MIAEIIAAGSEMLTPFRQDTNSLYLTAQLNELGVQVAFKTIVGDNRAPSPMRQRQPSRAPMLSSSRAVLGRPRTT